jgi:hypothetical protein
LVLLMIYINLSNDSIIGLTPWIQGVSCLYLFYGIR